MNRSDAIWRGVAVGGARAHAFAGPLMVGFGIGDGSWLLVLFGAAAMVVGYGGLYLAYKWGWR